MFPAALIEAAAAYTLAHPSCPHYAQQIRSRTAMFSAWLGDREPSSRLFNEYIALIESSGRQPETVRGHRTAILAVLRFAGWIPDAPLRLVRLRDRQIDCYTLEELRTLIKTASKMAGVLSSGLPLCRFWPLAIRAGYSTGLRYGDLLRVPAREIADDGIASISQSKTGRLVSVRFPREAMVEIRRHGAAMAVPWPYCGNHFRNEFRAIVIAAGVRRGSWKWLRRSAGTYMEQAKPGFGHKLLGNAVDIFRKHYWAYRLLNPGPPSPPEL